MMISSYSSIGMMSPVSNISKDIVTQNDKNSDSSLSIDELGVSEEQFSSLDQDSDGLVTQNEIASAIDSKLSQFDGQMPSKDEFESLISELGLQMPEPPISKEANDFSSFVMSNYDSDGDSLLSSSEVSVLSDEEFSALKLMRLNSNIYKEQLKTFGFNLHSLDCNLNNYIVITEGKYAGTILYNGPFKFVDDKNKQYLGIELSV